MSARLEQQIAVLGRQLARLKAKDAMKNKPVIEWWCSPNGKGCYHERQGRNITVTSQRYSRARDAARGARRRGERLGYAVRQIDPPRSKRAV